MTPQEAICFINSEIQIDVRFCSKEKVDKTKEALEYAISALEKQIPKKPTELSYIGSIFIGECPVCESGVNNKMKFCDKCGQALDWSDTE